VLSYAFHKHSTLFEVLSLAGFLWHPLPPIKDMSFDSCLGVYNQREDTLGSHPLAHCGSLVVG